MKTTALTGCRFESCRLRLTRKDKMENVLHIYGQDHEHDDAFIVGDIEALADLRDALTKIVDGGRASSSSQPYASDGEGYGVIIVRSVGDEMLDLEDQYTDGAEWRNRGNKKQPHELLTESQYLSLRKYNE